MPSATLTFLFTDIEGSTQLWERHPQGMQPALARHDALLGQAITAHGGAIVKRTGDGCHAVFPAALDGALAALEAQQALAAEAWAGIQPDALRVRMALHTGEAEMREGDYYGPALNRAARLMAVGHGGQILLSQVAAGLVRDQLPPGPELRDLGEHRLKDLTRPEHVYQLATPGLPGEFPALRSLDASANNLPVQLTHFIGREREITELRELLAPAPQLLSPSFDGRGAEAVRSAMPAPELLPPSFKGRGAGGVRSAGADEGVRLLTLTGAGGTGKTRLSLQVAAEALPRFPDGAWLAELAPVADPELVVQTIASALELREPSGRPLLEALSDFLRGKQLLLILDNCEHLIAACAGVADQLLRQCPKLKIMASSREALGIAGEHTYPVPSLSLPEAAAPTAGALAHSEAVRLFVDRAQVALPSFALTDENAPAVATICRRLDGIPLALELAAARVKLLRVEQIAARLDDRFRLLTGGSRTALPRQQTLRALIDWSYTLLAEPERACLQQLSVFAGGWTLEAAEAVCAASDLLDLLTQLANKSLVVVEREGGAEARYRLLETIRQYAREKLLDAPGFGAGGDPGQWRDRHLAYFLRFAETAEPELQGPHMVAWLDRLEREQDNFRAAMEWGLDHDPLSALRLATALGFFLGRRGYAEGRTWLETALARAAAARAAPAAPDTGEPARAFQLARARGLRERAAFDMGLVSDGAAARVAAEESVSLARQHGDTRTLVRSLWVLGMTEAFWGDPGLARASTEESLALARQANDLIGVSLALNTFLMLDVDIAPDLARARVVRAEALQVARQVGNPWYLAQVKRVAARLDADAGDLAQVRALFAEAASLFRAVGDLGYMNAARSDLAHTLRRRGRTEDALAVYRETLPVWQHLGHRGAIAHQFESLGFIALAQGQGARAARLLGAAEALRAASGTVRMNYEAAEYDQALARLRALLPAPELDEAWAAGERMNADEAIAYALITAA